MDDKSFTRKICASLTAAVFMAIAWFNGGTVVHAAGAPKAAARANLQPFTYPDGAISTLPIGKGDPSRPQVDPYFVNQALKKSL